MVQVVKNNAQDGPKLYICSTPIGNLSDVSERLVATLQSVDIVACEDTRHTRKLLTHYDIHPSRLISYHQHNEHARQDWMATAWEEGQSIALVSDAGTPLLSDPGALLVDTAIEHGIPVIPVPGPSALLAALVGSGMPMTPFVYLGFGPRSKKAVREWLMPYLNLQATLILYEAPHRLAATLGTLLEVVGDKRAVLAKELTKQHETYVRGSLSELAQYSEEVAPKGEYVIVLDNRGSVRQSAEEEIDAHALAVQFVRTRMMEGERHKAAVQEAVTRFSVNRRELYNATLGDEE